MTDLSAIASRLKLQLPSPELAFRPPWQGAGTLQLYVKRDDLIHPLISGNKWRKLKYHLAPFLANPPGRLLSFGGGHSNHLLALGYLCQQLGLPLTAVVRGDYTSRETPCLHYLQRWGVDIRYVSKLDYRRRHEPGYLVQLKAQTGAEQIIPEGGSSPQALKGVGEILDELSHDYDYILAPIASGGTLAGLIQSAKQPQAKIIGVAMLKGEGYLESLVGELLRAPAHDWQISHEYHGGGYAKVTQELTAFCQAMGPLVPLEPVYSGKLFMAARDMLAQGRFAPHSRVLLLHTGGLPCPLSN